MNSKHTERLEFDVRQGQTLSPQISRILAPKSKPLAHNIQYRVWYRWVTGLYIDFWRFSLDGVKQCISNTTVSHSSHSDRSEFVLTCLGLG
jgi:hypothetical protein